VGRHGNTRQRRGQSRRASTASEQALENRDEQTNSNHREPDAEQHRRENDYGDDD
jgi:hypothetical protein